MEKIYTEDIETLEDLLDIPISTPKDSKNYRIRDVIAYCEAKGISTEDITDE